MLIHDNISVNSSYREVFQTKVVEKIKTHVLCSVYIYIYISENAAFYGTVWKNTIEADRPQMTV